MLYGMLVVWYDSMFYGVLVGRSVRTVSWCGLIYYIEKTRYVIWYLVAWYDGTGWWMYYKAEYCLVVLYVPVSI